MSNIIILIKLLINILSLQFNHDQFVITFIFLFDCNNIYIGEVV